MPPYAIAGGVPARVIRMRFEADRIERLRALRWWDWPVERISEHLDVIRSGDIERLCALGTT